MKNVFIIGMFLAAAGLLSYSSSVDSLASFFETDVMAWAKKSREPIPGTTRWMNEAMTLPQTKSVKTSDTSLNIFSGSWKHKPSSSNDTLSANAVDGHIKTGLITTLTYRVCDYEADSQCDHAEEMYWFTYSNGYTSQDFNVKHDVQPY